MVKFPYVVLSTDAYRDMWEYHFHYFRKNQLQVHFDFFIVTESASMANAKMIHVENSSSWGDSVLRSLKCLRSLGYERALFTFDDLWIRTVDLDGLLHAVEASRHKDYLRLYCHFKPYLFEGMWKVNKQDPYKYNFVLSIWNFSAVESMVRSGDNPWSFEKRCSRELPDIPCENWKISLFQITNVLIKGKVDFYYVLWTLGWSVSKAINREKLGVIESAVLYTKRFIFKNVVKIKSVWHSFM